MYLQFVILILVSIACAFANAQYRVAVAHLQTQDISGTVLFSETDEGVRVTGNIVGLTEGDYGFHVHELGDTSTCTAAGAHFNPDGTLHGGRDRDHSERHAGDLGNIHFIGAENSNGVSSFDFVDTGLALRGRKNIVGRALILHEKEDDLGLTDHPDSLSTGNAGSRIACSVIGTHAPVEAWYED